MVVNNDGLEVCEPAPHKNKRLNGPLPLGDGTGMAHCAVDIGKDRGQ